MRKCHSTEFSPETPGEHAPFPTLGLHLLLLYKWPGLLIWGDARLYRRLVHTPGPLRARTVEQMQSRLSRLTFVFTSVDTPPAARTPILCQDAELLRKPEGGGETTAQAKEGAV